MADEVMADEVMAAGMKRIYGIAVAIGDMGFACEGVVGA
jgi:hypothetical protein